MKLETAIPKAIEKMETAQTRKGGDFLEDEGVEGGGGGRRPSVVVGRGV